MARFFSARFSEQKVYGINVNKMKLPGGKVTKGYRSHMRVEATNMRPGIVPANRLLNDEVVEYLAKFKLNNNKIHGVKNVKVWNSANTGDNPSVEYTDGDEHLARISVDEENNEVSLTVQNHGGAEKLIIDFLLFSDQKIKRGDVGAIQDYEVAQNYYATSEADEFTETITEEDLRAEATWYMERHANKHVQDLFNGDADITETLGDIHGYNNGNAGRGSYTGPKTVGSRPTTRVLDMVKLIRLWIKQEKLSADDTFIIAEFEGRQFILTMKKTETNQAAVAKILGICNDERAADSFDIKNESTYNLERPDKPCKDIANGTRGKNHFVAPVENIKWISIQPKSSS